jgi:hypothetical protein
VIAAPKRLRPVADHPWRRMMHAAAQAAFRGHF